MSAVPSIRDARLEDAEAMLLVHVAAIFAHGPAVYTDRQVAAWAAKTDGVDRYVDALEDGSRELLVAESGGSLRGFGELDVERGEIEAIFVDPERNGEGIGSALLDHLEERLRDRGFEVSELRSVLNAVDFYERRGYDRAERVTTRTTGGVELDSIRMEKRLR